MAKQTKCYRLEAHQVAAIQQLAKDNGESSESAALRFIIDDWVRRISAERNLAPPASEAMQAMRDTFKMESVPQVAEEE